MSGTTPRQGRGRAGVLIAAGVVLVLIAVLIAGLVAWLVAGRDDSPGDSAGERTMGGPATSGDAGSDPSAAGPDDGVDAADPDADDPALDKAISEPREDSVYPQTGNDVVDSLHYDLDLDWDAGDSTLTGQTVLTFRAARDAEEIPLDLAGTMEVSDALLDGQPTEYAQDGDDLSIDAAVEEDRQYQLTIDYAGTPEPVEAPTRRTDLTSLGLTVEDDGSLWTLQEPFGAFTWYPVNDQPADKALYDFTITAGDGMVGVANGELTDRSEDGDSTTTRFRLDSPASSYLTTLAVGDYAMETDETDSGVPLTYWAPADDERAMERLHSSRAAIEWLEERLGPYPFSSAGGVVVDAEAAMETQTLPTYGNTEYALSDEVIVHELAHQWNGDQVGPSDWSDMWLNEGLTMYVQATWADENGGQPLEQTVDQWRSYDAQLRQEAGPPGDYDPDAFAESNVYTSPAVMWHDLGAKVGEQEFWELASGWIEDHPGASVDRQQLFDYLEAETGLELTDWLTQWIEGKRAPDPL